MDYGNGRESVQIKLEINLISRVEVPGLELNANSRLIT